MFAVDTRDIEEPDNRLQAERTSLLFSCKKVAYPSSLWCRTPWTKVWKSHKDLFSAYSSEWVCIMKRTARRFKALHFYLNVSYVSTLRLSS